MNGLKFKFDVCEYELVCANDIYVIGLRQVQVRYKDKTLVSKNTYLNRGFV